MTPEELSQLISNGGVPQSTPWQRLGKALSLGLYKDPELRYEENTHAREQMQQLLAEMLTNKGREQENQGRDVDAAASKFKTQTALADATKPGGEPQYDDAGIRQVMDALHLGPPITVRRNSVVQPEADPVTAAVMGYGPYTPPMKVATDEIPRNPPSRTQFFHGAGGVGTFNPDTGAIEMKPWQPRPVATPRPTGREAEIQQRADRYKTIYGLDDKDAYERARAEYDEADIVKGKLAHPRTPESKAGFETDAEAVAEIKKNNQRMTHAPRQDPKTGRWYVVQKTARTPGVDEDIEALIGSGPAVHAVMGKGGKGAGKPSGGRAMTMGDVQRLKQAAGGDQAKFIRLALNQGLDPYAQLAE